MTLLCWVHIVSIVFDSIISDIQWEASSFRDFTEWQFFTRMLRKGSVPLDIAFVTNIAHDNINHVIL